MPRDSFNTSHVTLYRGRKTQISNNTDVSIHLMLLFIAVLKEDFEQYFAFQYISCYSLSGFVQYPIFNCNSFNTSHVTLYLISRRKSLQSSSVSIHLMLLFIGDADAAQSGDEDSFDTSHVTLYLVQPDFYLLVDVFQYISCYSLSLTRPCFFAAFSSFNTSHVTLYLKAVVSSFL